MKPGRGAVRFTVEGLQERRGEGPVAESRVFN